MLLLMVSVCLATGIPKVTYSIPPVPKEPVITAQTKWITHPVLGVVFLFIVDGIRVQCAHSVFYQAPYPECQGMVGRIEACMPISYENSALMLITDDPMPTVYGMHAEPTVCMVGHSRFYPVTEKSYGNRE